MLPSPSILNWLVDALEDSCVFPREDIICDCKEILDIVSIKSEESHETVVGKDKLLERLNQWQRDKEFLASLDLHIIFARHLRKCCRASTDGDFLDAWNHEDIKLDGCALADELENNIKRTLRERTPSRTDAGKNFKTELSFAPVEYFYEGLEKLIGYPLLNVDPMEAIKAEHKHDKPFYDRLNRLVDPRKEWNVVVRSGQFKIDEVDCDPSVSIRGSAIGHDLEHYVRLAETNFKESNLNRAEITALRLWTGLMHPRYDERIREHINLARSSRTTEKDTGYAFAISEGGYINTLHAINSGITKLARFCKVPIKRKVYRGMKMQQPKRDQSGCMGGVESSFLSASDSFDVAEAYSGDGASILEIDVGQVSKGADISWLSQFPHEKEILFNALSHVEFLGSPQLRFVPRMGKVIIYPVQVTPNMRSRTLDELVNLNALSNLDLDAGEKFMTQFSLMPLKYFYNGLEELLGYPSLNIDSMEAIKTEHQFDEPYVDAKGRRVDPRKEWNIVVRSGISKIDDVDCDPDFPISERDFAHDIEHYIRLADAHFKDAQLSRAEIVALRLWTGPMYHKYAGCLRKHVKKPETDSGGSSSVWENGYVNTLHAINSGIAKLTRIGKVPINGKVYRGYKNVDLPQLDKDQSTGIGGVESSFLATSESIAVAMHYCGDKGFMLEINVGQVNKGADISWLSQFPLQKEILFNAMSHVEFLEMTPLNENGIMVCHVQISSNVRSRTVDEFASLRKDLHLNLTEALLTQANRITGDRAKSSDHGLIKHLCWYIQEVHSKTISERGPGAEARVFNEGTPEYLKLVEDVIMFQELSLRLVDLVSDWFNKGSARWDHIMQMQDWQLKALRAAFKDNVRPDVRHLIFEDGEKTFEESIFDAENIDLEAIYTSSAILAMGKLLSLNPRLQSLNFKAEWATAEVQENLFKELENRERGITINGFLATQYAVSCPERLRSDMHEPKS